MLKPSGTYGEGDEALEFYAKHTAQIEVGRGASFKPCLYFCIIMYMQNLTAILLWLVR